MTTVLLPVCLSLVLLVLVVQLSVSLTFIKGTFPLRCMLCMGSVQHSLKSQCHLLFSLFHSFVILQSTDCSVLKSRLHWWDQKYKSRGLFFRTLNTNFGPYDLMRLNIQYCRILRDLAAILLGKVYVPLLKLWFSIYSIELNELGSNSFSIHVCFKFAIN